MKGLQPSEPVRLYSRRKLFSFVLFLVTNFSAILVPKKNRKIKYKHVDRHNWGMVYQISTANILLSKTLQVLSKAPKVNLKVLPDTLREWRDFQLPNPVFVTAATLIYINIYSEWISPPLHPYNQLFMITAADIQRIFSTHTALQISAAFSASFCTTLQLYRFQAESVNLDFLTTKD